MCRKEPPVIHPGQIIDVFRHRDDDPVYIVLGHYGVHTLDSVFKLFFGEWIVFVHRFLLVIFDPADFIIKVYLL